MFKRVILAGVLGGLSLIVWTFLVNGILGLRSTVDMNSIPEDRAVYELLKEHLTIPGKYIVNPNVSPETGFPGDEPVFSITYSGLGHGSAGSLALMHLVIAFLTPMIGALLLSATDPKILNSFSKKLMFFSAIGILIAVHGDLMQFGIGGYPLGDAMILAINDVVTWTIVGAVIAWAMKSEAPGRPVSKAV